MTDAEIAWSAGLFEGEGCIYLQPRNGASTRRLCITSTDRDVLERVVRILKVGRIHDGNNARAHPGWKPNFEWYICRWSEIEYVLRLFYPWLGERRREAADRMLANPPTRRILPIKWVAA